MSSVTLAAAPRGRTGETPVNGAAETAAETSTGPARSLSRTIAVRFRAQWAECALALAMGAALVFSGYRAYCGSGPAPGPRITSDSFNAHPPEGRVNLHPGQLW